MASGVEKKITRGPLGEPMTYDSSPQIGFAC